LQWESEDGRGKERIKNGAPAEVKRARAGECANLLTIVPQTSLRKTVIGRSLQQIICHDLANQAILFYMAPILIFSTLIGEILPLSGSSPLVKKPVTGHAIAFFSGLVKKQM
jgi:hypothetical protein